MRYYRLSDDRGTRLVVQDGEEVFDLTSARAGLRTFTDLANVSSVADVPVDELATRLRADADRVADEQVRATRLPPVSPDEVWAAGVTYGISEQARESESGMPEMYLDVYESDRPEIFFKATADHTVGPDEDVGIRGDSDWDVPEPELAVVLYRGSVAGYTIGNDMSSRSIEGANPLYLPQAKLYDKCCAIGPCVRSASAIRDPHDLTIAMRIVRDGSVVFEDSTSTSEMVRTCEDLVSAYKAHNAVPEVAVLLTGTSLVPPDEFTLAEGDTIHVDIEDIGTLTNQVVVV